MFSCTWPAAGPPNRPLAAIFGTGRFWLGRFGYVPIILSRLVKISWIGHLFWFNSALCLTSICSLLSDLS